MKGNMQVTLEGRGSLTLRESDHLATGGEGSVYKANGTVVKIYLDPAKAIAEGRFDKLNQLKAFSHEYLVSPRGNVFDAGGKPIGFWMDFSSGEALPRLFTNDVRLQIGFGEKETNRLVERMQECVRYAHQHKALIIDPNELNWMAILNGKGGPEPRLLDVDSWVLNGQFPKTVAVMPSIRDWHAKQLSELSDWFGLGVVTFQLYTGIHPYKGGLNGYKPSEWEDRMKKNASVFSPDIRLNTAVRDFNLIPAKLRGWYEAVFQNGDRSIPPSPFEIGGPAKAAQMGRIVVTASGTLVYDKLLAEINDSVVRVFPCGIVRLQSGRLVDLATKSTLLKVSDSGTEVVRLDAGWLIAEPNGQKSQVYTYVDAVSFTAQPLSLLVCGHRLFRADNRLFLVTDQGLTELKLFAFGKPVLATDLSWGAMVNSTRWFDSVGIMDAMNAMFLIAPFGEKAVAQIRVRELDGLKAISAKAGNRFVAVIGLDKNGAYQKLEFTFTSDYKSYTVWKGQADSPDLNMTILPKGVGVTIVQDGELTIFVPSNARVNKVPDKDIKTSDLLAHWSDRVLLLRQGEVWSVRT